jgi:hypothetical protein
MLAWLGDLNAKERRTMAGCFGGWALDAFDVQMYSFVIPTVIALWNLSPGEAGLIGTVTLLVSSLGGWFSGTLADRFGRVRMLQITIQVNWRRKRLFIPVTSVSYRLACGAGCPFVRAVSADTGRHDSCRNQAHHPHLIGAFDGTSGVGKPGEFLLEQPGGPPVVRVVQLVDRVGELRRQPDRHLDADDYTSLGVTKFQDHDALAVALDRTDAVVQVVEIGALFDGGVDRLFGGHCRDPGTNVRSSPSTVSAITIASATRAKQEGFPHPQEMVEEWEERFFDLNPKGWWRGPGLPF